MNLLGISCYFHDSAAVLLRDGILVAAAEEERFSRVKHDSRFPRLGIDFCLRQAGITAAEVDYVVFYEKPMVKLERILSTTISLYPYSWEVFREAAVHWLKERFWIKDKLARTFNIDPQKILFVDHHASHAASAFFCSPFKDAAILTVDGVGEWSTATMGTATADWDGTSRTSLSLTHELRFPHSLGLLYSVFTAFLGFEVNEGEYKVMGMAPYGEAKYLDEIARIARVSPEGALALDLDYFAFHRSTHRSFSKRFVRLFGAPRLPESSFIPGERLSQHYADIAASIQRFTEDVLVKMAGHLHSVTGLPRLCMAGGVALNSIANARILRETPFQELFIQPAAGDSGGALGAALYAWHVLLRNRRAYVMGNAYLGEGFSDADMSAHLTANSISHDTVTNDAELAAIASREIQQGKVIGWFQGRFEWGPRALGNRSILADPRDSTMKGIVNSKIKFREPFRPFAPAVLEERVSDFFYLPEKPIDMLSRFMLLVLPYKTEAAGSVPAVDHLGTGRLQSVRREWNPRFHALLSDFAAATGVPALLNTSFNLRGEPIVATPADALKTFRDSGLDLLVLGNCIVRK